MNGSPFESTKGDLLLEESAELDPLHKSHQESGKEKSVFVKVGEPVHFDSKEGQKATDL